MKKIESWSDLKKFTFKVKVYKTGEWTAQCKEVSGIITGDSVAPLVEDAICCAMNVKKLPKNLKIVYSLT